MNDRELSDSRQWCRKLTRRAAGNFFFSFLTLPAAQFQDMCTLYAFCRVTDDIGDDPGLDAAQRRKQLNEWQSRFESACSPREPVPAPPGLRSDHGQDLRDSGATSRSGEHVDRCAGLPALSELIERRRIPLQHLLEIIEGVRRDLTGLSIETFDDLQDYCYHVAGAVGMCCLYVWGFESDDALPLAVDCGLAFQLTNILRDVGEDAAHGRIYLPAEDLRRFNVEVDNLRNGINNRDFQQLMKFQTRRARSYYSRALNLHDHVSSNGRPILSAMLRLYGGLLERLEQQEFPVLERRVRLPLVRKLWITVHTCWNYRIGKGRLPRSLSTLLESAESSPTDPPP